MRSNLSDDIADSNSTREKIKSFLDQWDQVEKDFPNYVTDRDKTLNMKLIHMLIIYFEKIYKSKIMAFGLAIMVSSIFDIRKPVIRRYLEKATKRGMVRLLDSYFKGGN